MYLSGDLCKTWPKTNGLVIFLSAEFHVSILPPGKIANAILFNGGSSSVKKQKINFTPESIERS
jgi:hypothetical protein